MSAINELVDRLRVEAKSMGKYGMDYMATLLTMSADTIGILSKKAKEPKQGWIPCSERLPEVGTKTILLYDSEEISGGTYIGNLIWTDAFASKNEFVKVIAWMPSPDPPRGRRR